jgi:putative transposase
MPRHTRFCPAGFPVHIIQRGNNRQACFTCDQDIAAYAHWLDEGSVKYGVAIHGWVFMTNHTHLLLTPTSDDGISRLMQYLGRLYVRRFNYRYTRTGTLFDGRYKSSMVQDDQYLLNCLQYMELNPVRAGIVKDPGDYTWSSYKSHAFGKNIGMWTPHPLYLGLGSTHKSRQNFYREIINEALTIEAIAKIRHCANTGLVLGTEKFRDQVESMRA